MTTCLELLELMTDQRNEAQALTGQLTAQLDAANAVIAAARIVEPWLHQYWPLLNTLDPAHPCLLLASALAKYNAAQPAEAAS